MDSVLLKQLDRVEAAFSTLIDSITSYNPSVPAAIELSAADDTLTQGLNELTTHQANYARLTSLRQEADSLNERIKSSLRLLADTRKEVLATPATVFPSEHRDVPYAELLSYAKHISKFTVPPSYRPPQPQQRDQNNKAVNGTPAVKASPRANDSATADEKSQGIGVSNLTQPELQWLDPTTQVPFVPWPSEEVIKRGALAQIQGMLEQGIDPASVTVTAAPGSGGPEGDGEKEEGQMEGVKVEVEEAVGVRSAAPAAVREMPKEERPRVFQGIDLFDPDEEE